MSVTDDGNGDNANALLTAAEEEKDKEAKEEFYVYKKTRGEEGSVDVRLIIETYFVENVVRGGPLNVTTSSSSLSAHQHKETSR